MGVSEGEAGGGGRVGGACRGRGLGGDAGGGGRWWRGELGDGGGVREGVGVG